MLLDITKMNHTLYIAACKHEFLRKTTPTLQTVERICTVTNIALLLNSLEMTGLTIKWF